MSSEKNDKKKLGKGTKSVHSGTSPSENSLNTPVYQTSTFYLDDKGYKMWMAGEPRAPVYSGKALKMHWFFHQEWQQFVLHYLIFLAKEIEL